VIVNKNLPVEPRGLASSQSGQAGSYGYPIIGPLGDSKADTSDPRGYSYSSNIPQGPQQSINQYQTSYGYPIMIPYGAEQGAYSSINQTQDPNYPYGTEWLPYPQKGTPEGNAFLAATQAMINQGRRNIIADEPGQRPQSRSTSPIQTSNVHFTYQKPNSSTLLPEGQLAGSNIVGQPNSLSLFPLPIQTERSYVIDANGNKAEVIKQTGHLDTHDENGGSYAATYLYTSEVKSVGGGEQKV